MPHAVRNTIITLLFLLLLTAGTAFAAPMSPFHQTLKQPDGTEIQAVFRGDEFQSWTELVDTGHTIILNTDSDYWEYAKNTSSEEKINRIRFMWFS